jgi:hypothetical protein
MITIRVRGPWTPSTALELDVAGGTGTVNSLGEQQVAAIADFLSWPIHRSGVVTFDLAR